jgi:hypothetical protein
MRAVARAASMQQRSGTIEAVKTARRAKFFPVVVPAFAINQRCRHPEVLAVFGEPRRMPRARMRPSFETPRKRAAPQDDGGMCGSDKLNAWTWSNPGAARMCACPTAFAGTTPMLLIKQRLRVFRQSTAVPAPPPGRHRYRPPERRGAKPWPDRPLQHRAVARRPRHPWYPTRRPA